MSNVPKARRHNMHGTPTYHCWSDMLRRCSSPKSSSYVNYGARGIKVCERWHDFRNFLHDMGVRPEGMSLDRIAVDIGYAPDNCRWATRQEQARNTRLRKANKSGIHGVWWYADRQVFKACIHREGKVVHLGHTPDFLEACCLRKSAEIHLS